MEFSPRGFQRNNTPRPAATGNTVSEDEKPFGGIPDKPSSFKKGVDKLRDSKMHTSMFAVLFFSLLILTIATIIGISIFGNKEMDAVDKANYQAVVLADGQAYFGKITDINGEFLKLRDVFYVQGQQLGSENTQNQTAARLIKLGCEIHGPQDQMVIYRSQIVYWENLKSDGRVPELIGQFKEDNPNGQTCTTQNPTTEQQTNDTSNGDSSNTDAQNGAGTDNNNDTTDNQDTTTPSTDGDTPTQDDGAGQQ